MTDIIDMNIRYPVIRIFRAGLSAFAIGGDIEII